MMLKKFLSRLINRIWWKLAGETLIFGAFLALVALTGFWWAWVLYSAFILARFFAESRETRRKFIFSYFTLSIMAVAVLSLDFNLPLYLINIAAFFVFGAVRRYFFSLKAQLYALASGILFFISFYYAIKLFSFTDGWSMVFASFIFFTVPLFTLREWGAFNEEMADKHYIRYGAVAGFLILQISLLCLFLPLSPFNIALILALFILLFEEMLVILSSGTFNLKRLLFFASIFVVFFVIILSTGAWGT